MGARDRARRLRLADLQGVAGVLLVVAAVCLLASPAWGLLTLGAFMLLATALDAAAQLLARPGPVPGQDVY